MVYYKENLTAKARVQNCVMCISVGRQANLNSGTYIPLPATDGSNARFQRVTLQAVIYKKGGKQDSLPVPFHQRNCCCTGKQASDLIP